MKIAGSLRSLALASAAAIALVGCSDTDISSPGAPAPVPTPAPTPTPTPTPTGTINLIPTAGCPTGTSETLFDAVAADGFSSVSVCALGSSSGAEITSDLTIPANTTIAIQGPVFVGQDGGTSATLTLEQGVRIMGASAAGTANATDDYLVVSRGSQIVVNGTSTNPVRMTARGAMNDEETGSSLIQVGSNGLWGGLVINGFAPINDCGDATATGGDADCQKQGEGASGLFGGDQADDNSGSINYLIVEYAGSRLTNDDELNGIAFQGVGSGTTVSHIQVHNNLDDGVEWFGGTVNVKYLAVTGAGDDSIDWTDGWSGRLQFAAVYSNVPSSGDPRGIEADNRDGTNDKTPFSDPQVSNFTLIGTSGNQQGILLRRGTKGAIMNGVVAGFPTGLDVDSSQTFTNFTNGDLTISSLLIDAAEPFATDSDGVPAFQPSDNIVTRANSLTDRFFPGSSELTVTPTQPSVSEQGFFGATIDYIGAFGPSETIDSNWASFTLPGTLFPAQAPATCPSGTTDSGDTLDGKTLCMVAGPISGSVTLTNGDELIYELDGTVFVGSDRGAELNAPNGFAGSLTIEKGVTVVAEGNDDYLVVSRGSKIFSNGTEADPVVFTAKGVLDGSVTATTSLKGVWGGLVINGRAPINDCGDGTAVGGTINCEKSGEGASGSFGGATADDDSGQLFYTRVQYAGVRLTNDDELNGIAFQGVGSGTEVSYIQVTNNLDDGIEWFGGTVSADHVVVTGVGDDSIDWTDGWQGSLQFAIAYPGVAGADGGMSGDPRGIEGDNRDGTNDKTPFSEPKISNLTLVNSGDAATQQGVLLRRGTKGLLANAIVAGWSVGLDVDSTQTFTNFTAGDLEIKSILLDNTVNFATDSDGVPAFLAADNVVEGTAALTGENFTFVPGTRGVVLAAADTSVPAFDVTGYGDLTPVNYIGAVADANDNWYLGWTVDLTGSLTSK